MSGSTNQNLPFILQPKFLFRALAGSLVTLILIYIITIPAFMSPLYQSQATVYVPLTFLSRQIDQDGIGFGSETEISGYIQILQSNLLYDSLIQRFDLFNVYKTPAAKIGSKHLLFEMLDARIDVKKTRYESVLLTVKDESPERAAQMVNAIIDLGNVIKETMLYPNRLEAMMYKRRLYHEKQEEVNMLEKQLDSLGIHTMQPKEPQNFKVVKQYENAIDRLSTYKNDYDRTLKDFSTPLPKAYLISEATVAPDPVWPPRLLFMVLGEMAFLLLLLIFETVKQDAAKEKL